MSKFIDLNFFKNKYFKNNIIIKSSKIYKEIRNNILVNESNEYTKLSTIEIFKLISDKFFFYGNNKNQSIKNMLYGNTIPYQDFTKETQIESYLYRMLNDSTDRVMIFINKFSDKNNPNNINYDQKKELLENMNNDIIYLSNNIILLKNNVFLPWLWKCTNEPFINLKLLENKFSTYYLRNKWTF